MPSSRTSRRADSTGRPAWDLGTAAQEWIPLHAPDGRADHPSALDAVTRFGRFAAAYGVEPGQEDELWTVVVEEREHSVANIRANVAAGDPVWTEHWGDAGKEADEAVDRAWLTAQREAFVAAVGHGSRRRGAR